MFTRTRHSKQMFKNQQGQSMTQYLILTFMLATGSLVVVGKAGQVTQNQVASVSHEVSGNSVQAKASTVAAQENAKYASANAGTANTLGISDSGSSNPVTNPTGPNTTPSVPANPNPSSPTNPITAPTTPGTPTTPVTPNPVGPNPIINPPTTTPVTPTPLTPVVEPTEPEIKCTTPTPEDDDGSTKTEEDKGFWGSLWDEVKDGLVAGYEFVKGFWEGMKKQVADLGDLLAHPIETAKGLIALGKQFVEDPAGTAKMIADALGDEFNTLVHCGAFDKGRIIGENVSPAFMVKLASKMVKFGNLAKALKATKKDFGCASFAANTAIWTTDGKVNVESLRKGNTVLSRNEKGYEDKPQAITNTFGRTAEHYFKLQTEFETISVTAEHPVWKQGRGWTEAQYLKVDDVVASADGDVLILDNQKIDEPLQVYNFSVENTPSYFAGDSKLWVHNAKCTISNLLDKLNESWPKIDKDRLYSGTTTKRENLRDRIKTKFKDDLDSLSFGWEAHHIIPWELSNSSMIKRLNIDMNSLDNAIPLPCKPGSGSACSLHSGSHGNYSAAIEKQLDKIEAMNINDAAKKSLVEKTITAARDALTKGNPPLRNTDGATVVDWDNIFKDL